MPDLLIELFSEEIPARMQRKAAEDLKSLVTNALVERGFVYEGARAFATPRRLALHVAGLPVKGQDVREERKGPRVGAPDAAIQGFLKSAGLASIDQATIQSDPKKGDSYIAIIEKPGRATTEVVAEIVPAVVRAFPWPKSMRWGAASAAGASLRWVRPLHTIVCTFGPETEEPEVIRFEVDGVPSGDVTFGHRFLSDGQPFRVKRLDDYVAKLEKAHVILDADRRKQIILTDAKNLAFAQGLELIEDEGLLEEVAGLVEWPTVLMGSFDEAFLAIPGEVIRATIRANQKCFVLRAPSPSPLAGEGKEFGVREGSHAHGIKGETPHPVAAPPPSPARGEGVLANRFLLISNQVAPDGGKAIVAGNERVVRARLADALHFWKTDQRPLPDVDKLSNRLGSEKLELARPLDQRMARLDHLGVVFHEKLGTQGERVQRIAALARELAKVTGADPELCARAAVLAKADLQTEVVGEFPELQGFMGRRYAELQGEHPSVCAAIEDHYKPLGPSDRVPTDPVAITVALADKLDTLVGFWAIDEKPTGSKDPYALRRAALGVIRLVVENGVRVSLVTTINLAAVCKVVHLLLHDGHFFKKLLAQYDGEMGEAPPDPIWTDLPYRNFLDWNDVSSEKEIAISTAQAQFPGNDQFDSDDVKVGNKEANRLYEKILARATAIDAFVAIAWFSDHSNIVAAILDHPDYSVTAKSLSVRFERDLLSFFHDRLKVMLKDQGARHDLVDAVLAAPSPSPMSAVADIGNSVAGEGKGEGSHSSGQASATPHPSAAPTPSPVRGEGGANDDLLLVVRRVEALTAFLATEDGANLLGGYKRAANILRAEEKKDGGGAFAGAVEPALLVEPEEKALAAALAEALPAASAAVAREAYGEALAALSRLRQPVDAFFEAVIVNAPDPAIRANRLRLLSSLRAATLSVADFGRIAG